MILAFQFPAGHDVVAGSQPVEQAQDPERRIGLDRVADQMGNSGEGIGKEPGALGNLIAGVDIQRGSIPASQPIEREYTTL